jgi:hypothetical protein
MGRFLSGINGPIHGKVGTVIGSSRNGIPYIKGPYKKRTLVVSEEELSNRKKFAMAQAWLKPLLSFVREGFRGYSQRSYGFIAAKSWLLKNAFIAEGNKRWIDPSLVRVSHGDLPNPETIGASFTDSGDLKFTWSTEGGESIADDQVMMLAYNIEKGIAIYKNTGQLRKTGFDILKMEQLYGIRCHVYAAFNAADRSRQSNSVYLGEF